MLKRSKSLIIAALLGAGVALTSCAPPSVDTAEPSSEVADNPSSGDTTLSFWTNLTVDAQAQVIQEHANQCAADLDGVSLEFEAIPFDSMYSRMVTAFRSGSGPDIMNTLEGAVAFGQAGGHIVPVDDLIADIGEEDFIPSFLHAVSKDDHVWGVPDWALHQEVWYRKDLFEKYDIEIPTTWAELLVAAKTIHDNEDGVDGFIVPLHSALVAPQVWYQFLYAEGITTFDPDTGEYVFEDHIDEAVAATEFMLELYSTASPEESRTWAWSEFRNAYALGQAGMVLDFGAVVGLAAEQNPEMLENMGVFSLPTESGEDPAASLGGGYFYMLGNNEESRQELSKQLVACMMSSDLVAERTNTRPIFALPATYSATESDVFTSNETVQQFEEVIQTIRDESLPTWYRYGMEAGLNPLAGQIEATTFIGDSLQAAAAGKISAQEAVEQINDELKRLAAEDAQ